MPSEYYKTLDVLHETALSLAFRTEATWNDLFIPEELFPSDLPVYGEVNAKELSDEVTRVLVRRGHADMSTRLVEIEETGLPLSKNGLRYIFYFLYSEALHPKSHFNLHLKATSVENRYTLEAIIPPKAADKLFSYLTVENPSVFRNNTDFNSTLYIWLCRYAIKKMKGNIAQTESGIRITLPLQELPAGNAGKEGRKSILLLEDKDEMSWLIDDILAESYIIHRVSTTQKAFEYLRKHAPDIFLADTLIYLEKENKFIEYVESYKGLLTKTVFIPMLTWKAVSWLQNELHNLIDGFVVMPYSILFLREVIDMAVNRNTDKEHTLFVLPEQYGQELICHTTEQSGFAKQLMHILDENLDKESLNIPFIAERMAISTRQYYRKFKEISELSPADFIKGYRLDKAAHLLSETDWPIQRVIDAIGIQSRSYFHKEFTTRFGVTPKSYQKNMQGKKEEKENTPVQHEQQTTS